MSTGHFEPEAGAVRDGPRDGRFSQSRFSPQIIESFLSCGTCLVSEVLLPIDSNGLYNSKGEVSSACGLESQARYPAAHSRLAFRMS